MGKLLGLLKIHLNVDSAEIRMANLSALEVGNILRLIRKHISNTLQCGMHLANSACYNTRFGLQRTAQFSI